MAALPIDGGSARPRARSTFFLRATVAAGVAGLGIICLISVARPGSELPRLRLSAAAQLIFSGSSSGAAAAEGGNINVNRQTTNEIVQERIAQQKEQREQRERRMRQKFLEAKQAPEIATITQQPAAATQQLAAITQSSTERRMRQKFLEGKQAPEAATITQYQPAAATQQPEGATITQHQPAAATQQPTATPQPPTTSQPQQQQPQLPPLEQQQGQVCQDLPEWIDSRGDDCGWYSTRQRCKDFGRRNPFARGYTAAVACCACGGGKHVVEQYRADQKALPCE